MSLRCKHMFGGGVQVYQGIDLTLNRLDNVVELRRPALPVPSFVPVKALPAEALLTLKHSVAVTGPATVQITFVGTDVNLQGAPTPLLIARICTRINPLTAHEDCTPRVFANALHARQPLVYSLHQYHPESHHMR